MSNNAGLSFLNSLLGSITQSAQSDNDVVVEANFKIRMADPKRVAPVIENLNEKEESEEKEREPRAQDQPPIRGISAGTRIPEARVEESTIPTTAPAPLAGSRIDAATRQTQAYAPAPRESPELVPNAITAPVDYNPEYQEQFDRYLRTRQFDHMYGPALRGVGAPAIYTPRRYE